ncbi:MAG: hypothetical protein LBQ89_08915 [Treponema sp.]|jgi:hypothetical protein|nr:hypothetical protein [Treponema sp.]
MTFCHLHKISDRLIDLRGISRFTSLEVLYFSDSEPYNIEDIGELINLRIISVNLTSPIPSVEFIKNLNNLEHILFYGNNHFYPYGLPSAYTTEILESEATQILDVSPLASLKNSKSIFCRNFILKNISALDALDVGTIDIMGSRLYDKTEKSKHYLLFRLEGDR